MEVIEEIFSEVSQRAGSPEGFFRLIHLLLQEVESIDFSDPEAAKKYVTLLRAYVLVKRQMAVFSRRCELVEVDLSIYKDTMLRLKTAIKSKREEARVFARDNFDPERLKELKQSAGRNMGFHHGDIVAVPISPAVPRPSPYMGQKRPWGSNASYIDHAGDGYGETKGWIPGFMRKNS